MATLETISKSVSDKENRECSNQSISYDDDLLPHLGSFGKYQKRVYFLLCLPAISYGLQLFVGVFLLATPEHRCKLPPDDHINGTFSISHDVWKENYPMNPLTKQYSKCRYYSNATDPTVEITNCENWIYDDSKHRNTVVVDWDLVCGRSFLRASANAMLMFGDLIGSFIFGHFSDKYGRKPTFFVCLLLQVVFGILGGLAPEYYTFAICKLVIGAAVSGMFVIAYVLSIEMVGPKIRLYASEIIMTFFSLGYVSTAAFAYFIHDWRMLQIAISLPGILFLSYWWLVPESIRWLLAENRNTEALVIIDKAVEVNSAKVPKEILDRIKNGNYELKDMEGKSEEKKATLGDVFHYPNLRYRSIIIFINFFLIDVVYFGLSWNTHNLGNNHFTNFVLSGAVEIPAYIFDMLTLNRYGRTTILPICMTFTGVALLLTSLIPSNMEWLIVLLATIAKMTITSSYGTIFISASEQFPTVVRNVLLGAAVTVSRIGGIAASFIILLSDYWKPLPMIVMGVCCLVGCVLARMLPETFNQKLPETLADAENFGTAKEKELEI